MAGDARRRGAGLARAVADVALGAPRFATAPLLRRWHLRWGATDTEVAAPMPGDELVQEPSFNATRAITINAPPEAVWPWLVQLGFGRAGWYAYDLLDNAARPSAERILPEYQQAKVGDWVPMAGKVNETTAFKIAGVEPKQWMLWKKPHSSWAWKLVPLDGGRTRLVTRLKARYAWRTSPGNALLTLILFEFGDFAMMRKLLLGVKRRAEQLAADAQDNAHVAQTRNGDRLGERSGPISSSPPTVAIDLYWLPLGAGGHSVRLNGRIFEAVAAQLGRRARCDLYHSALKVRVPEGWFVIEQAPIRPGDGPERGVVAEGAVGARAAGRFRLFRYEIRRWRGGVIPDIGEAVESPRRLSDDPDCARRLLELVPQVPTPVWGRDELRAGEMWNSNSLISWLIAGSGLDVESIRPPAGGRAPGWQAGIVVAHRQQPQASPARVAASVLNAG
jgi:hypothetical protein